MLLYKHAKAVFSCVLSQWCGGGVSNCISSNNKRRCGARKQLCSQHFNLWPQPNFFIHNFSKLVTHVYFSGAGWTLFPHKPAPLTTTHDLKCISPLLGHRWVDPWNEFHHIEQSTLLVGAHTEKKNRLDEWVVYLLWCRAGLPKCHFIMRLQNRVQRCVPRRPAGKGTGY